ncbi:unnamed protein product [Rhodiola kirilowii]
MTLRHGYVFGWLLLKLKRVGFLVLGLVGVKICLKKRIRKLQSLNFFLAVRKAAVSAGTGQLLKPFSSSWLYGKDFSLSSAIQAGGFPSTHSSAVIATATSIALERGFADPIFGMAVVYASLVMYDAQGVRREVGTHAKALNQILPKKSSASPVSSADNTRDPTTFPFLKPSSSDQNNLPKSSPTSTLIRSSSSNVINVNSSEDDQTSLTILKESIGHTEVEVIAGGLLGFLVSLAVSNIL